MRKFFALLCVTALACSMVCGCSNAPTDPLVQNTPNVTDRDNTSTDGHGNDPASSDNTGGQSHSFVYTSEDCIYPMSQPVTADGVEYQVLKCEVTSEFGERNFDNLNYFYNDGGIDDKGNLINDNRYVFLTIQYKNTTDTEIEIIRGSKGIFFLDEHFIVDDLTIDTVYIDEKRLDGPANESYYYYLAPGETITCEVGWIVSKETVDNHANIYYAVRQNDCWTEFGGATDPDAIYIELEY